MNAIAEARRPLRLTFDLTHSWWQASIEAQAVDRT